MSGASPPCDRAGRPDEAKTASVTALHVIACLAFVSLGLPDGLLGVAWPSIRRSFGLEQSHLGLLLACVMAGNLASSFASGPLVARLGVGRLLVASSAAMAASLLGYALVPAWGFVLSFGLLAGLGAGAVDAWVNSFAAGRFSAGFINLLHACYGLGAALGPLTMAQLIGAGIGWRHGYGILAAVLAGMALCFWWTIDRWKAPPRAGLPAGSPPLHQRATARETLRRPAAWAGMALFFLYTGLETAVGQWSFSLLTEARRVEPMAAGAWVSAYWGSLAGGRLLFGLLARRFTSRALLRVGMAGATAGTLLLWLPGSRAVGLIALPVMGFSLAPVFPLLIAGTPLRLGGAHAGNAIGFQVCAAYLGAAAVPAAAGWLAGAQGLEVLGPFLFTAAVCLIALNEAVTRAPEAAGAAPRAHRYGA